ncbi:MAG: N-acetylmuramoyl-L-alanine amidase LytC precursor [bacterium ADurb.Bin363]|nr:MAG: N-acetylmuramoyl-L-alanine amidase LytC precursor [bacterium ADurb.Bin363]
MRYFIVILILTGLFLSPVRAQDNPVIILNGKNVEFTKPVLFRDNMFFLPADDKGTGNIVKYFEGTISCNEEEVYIAKSGKPSRFKIGQKRTILSGQEGTTMYPSFFQDNHIYLSLDDFTSALYVHYIFDKEVNSIKFLPAIYSISCKEIEDRIDILASATSQIDYRINYSKEDFSFIVEVPDCFVSLSGNIVPGNSDIIKDIKTSQMDNIACLKIILKRAVPIAISPRINLSSIPIRIDLSGNPVTELWLPEVSEDLLKEECHLKRPGLIKNLDFEVTPDKKIIRIDTGGFLAYEWHRLSEGDNRFYIDFTRAVLRRKSLIKLIQDDIISDIKLVQITNKPELVRLVFQLKKKVNLIVVPSEDKINELLIVISNNEDLSEEFPVTGKGFFGRASSGSTIVIDPGHGGRDTGAINSSMGLQEKDINLDIALRVEQLLIKAGYNVILTRMTDRDLTWDGSPDRMELEARTDVANNLKASVFVSIHNDSSCNKDLNGTCTYYYKDIDYDLACILQKHLIAQGGLKNRGIKRSDFYVLKHTDMPAVLLEIAFMSNKGNALLLMTSEFRDKVAVGICNGLMEYLENIVLHRK